MSANFSNVSVNPLPYHCSNSRAAFLIFTTFVVVKTLVLLPLSVLVLHLGHKRWRQQRSFKTTSHSAIFTYHLVTMELISILGSALFVGCTFAHLPSVAQVGFYALSVALPGELLLHCLTCVERYLAAVHPITYLGLRQGGGVRIRNISIGCVWLLCFGWIGLTALHAPDMSFAQILSVLVFSVIVVSFCSLSTLCVLIGTRPGKVGGHRRQVDQSKQRAFCTITTILGVLFVWFAGLLVCVALDASPLLSHSDGCVVLISGICFGLPASLVLPLLFLHRAGKLRRCHQSNQ